MSLFAVVVAVFLFLGDADSPSIFMQVKKILTIWLEKNE